MRGLRLRVCFFTPDIDSEPNDCAALLAKSNCGIGVGEVAEFYLASHRYSKSGLDGNRYYIFDGYESLKATICRRMLRLIDALPWLPPVLALIPLRLCRREITESFVAFDPDVIVLLDVRWGRQLKRLLQKQFPHWAFADSFGRPNVDSSWREYDPTVKVSIVLPTYNGSKYLRQSVESCLNQTFKNIELLVVDDGSEAHVAETIQSYCDPRIQYIRHDVNRGLPEALNSGFRRSTGNYLTWTSDDNYYAPTAVEEMVRYLHTYPAIDFVYAESVVIDEREPGSGTHVLKPQPSIQLGQKNIVGACFLYKREVYEQIGEYNPKLFLSEDYDYWLRVANRFKMQRLSRKLYYYRFHDGSLTCTSSSEQIASVNKLMRQLNGLPS